ncbi:MAG: radical SAM protein [Candidatus Omnitrophica bacterium]|nr:radical SAM protein [Candidatus Omnitrophota bacterium]
MKVLLLNPPFLPKFSRFSRSPAVTKSGTIYYPIWHAYAAGVLENSGHAVKLIDACADGLSRQDCYDIACDFKPDIAVLYTSTPSIYNDVQIAGEIKDLFDNCVVVLAGPHVSALIEESLNLDKRVDGVICGEYDATLLEIADSLQLGKPIKNISGTTFRDGEKFIHNHARPFIEDLDSIPFVSAVYKKHLNIENYFYAHCRYPVVSIFSSRGCYGQCNYCVYPEKMFGRKQRQRTPENIVAEFEYIEKELPQVQEVLVDDDTFSFDQKHTMRFCELMIEKGIKLPWTVECRTNLKYETMAMMKKAGCRLIVVGFESADDDILKNVKKGTTLQQMQRFVVDAKKAGILLHSCFMAGNMGETRETLMKSLKFAKKINADTAQFFPLMVYPGTEAYQWAKDNEHIIAKDFRDWLDVDGMHNCVINTASLSAQDLVDFCDYARKKYYLNPRYLAYKTISILRTPKELGKTIKAGRIFFKYLFCNNR